MAVGLKPINVTLRVLDLYERRNSLPNTGTSYHVVVEGRIYDPSSSRLETISRQEWEIEEKRYRQLRKMWDARTCDARELVLTGKLEVGLQVK